MYCPKLKTAFRSKIKSQLILFFMTCFKYVLMSLIHEELLSTKADDTGTSILMVHLRVCVKSCVCQVIQVKCTMYNNNYYDE